MPLTMDQLNEAYKKMSIYGNTYGVDNNQTQVDNTSTGQHWKLGTFRLDIQPDGRR